MTTTYNPEVKIYYGPLDTNHRLIPAPMISISKENTYVNDSIIGFNYVITLQGFATGFDLRDVNGNYNPEDYSYNFGSVIDHIHKIRKILSQNGNILNIVDSTDVSILKAKGGILRSFTFDKSNNNWNHFANYTATIEFNSIEFIGADWQTYTEENCADIHLKDGSYSDTEDAGIVNIQKFKIKSFDDSWSINFDENDAFNRVELRDNNQTHLNINNRSFNIEYTISATGKNHYVYSDENNNSSTLLPAWEQAKNFVQYRLYEQVTNLINGVLKNTATSGCDTSSTETPNTSCVPGLSSNGLLKDIGNSKYKVFNENITCEASEADGSFSATYRATIKNNEVTNFSIAEAKHTVSKSFNIANTNNKRTINISINGTIEGLLEGGIINSSKPISLPNSGSILIYQNDNNTKYNNAKLLLDKIYREADYNGGIGSSGKKDLIKDFKDKLGITLTDLGRISPAIDDPVDDPPHPISFNLTHDYNNGTINYSVEYSSDINACGRKYQEISIQTTNPTKVIATFNVPNSNTGPIIQELGTRTAKVVTVNIQGSDSSQNGKPRPISLINELDCTASYLPVTLPVIDGILTNKEYSKNITDGSYTINLTYICNNLGCNI